MSAVDDVAARAQHTLDAWRERGADRLDPVRFRFIDALRRRAAAHGGDARRLLDARLATLIDAYAADLRRAESNGDACECAGAPAPAPAPAPASSSSSSSSTSPAPTPTAPSTTTTSPAASSPADPARGPLAALLDYIGSRERPTASAPDETRAAPASSTASGRVALRAEPALLDYFRETWSKLSADSQLRASLEQVPKNAGPLNSSSLVHRSLSLMRELSPEYLRQFLSYVDALSWLQQMNGDEAATGDEAARGAVGGGGGASAKKNTRKRSR
ncbi:chemotaxis motB protein [Burkholderia pseudomallei]|nr:chemotaxis motB protein [Burkholderia pseudomallei]CAJ3782643.1 chemotaxis motB protein [Burkholderia pseudomallei]CAJ4459700.1 chemotaxis motB protein [Burkholderia pseudomallei]CAJ4510877.1 chemotaxis motB protein [Burkholderia pseudomallei]CAJ5084586.1 chemotaxis motB protein [Burkholderia pseudomallei]